MIEITAVRSEKSGAQKLTDEQLFNLCRKYGENAKFWRQKFAGLLPEVFRRSLYEKKGFPSIFVFAAKLAGLSHEQVRLALNLERKFEDVPILHSLLVNGEVSINKLARVASIATPENQEALAQQVQILSNRALETLVRDEKMAAFNTGMDAENAEKGVDGNPQIQDPDGLQKPPFNHESLHVHSKPQDISTVVKIMEKLSPEVIKQLLELIDKNIDINEIISETLKEREAGIAGAKEEAAAELAGKAAETQAEAAEQHAVGGQAQRPAGEQAQKNAGGQGKAAERQAEIEEQTAAAGQTEAANQLTTAKEKTVRPPSRHIPAKIKHIIDAEQGDKCSVPGCNKSAQVIHHELPFALTKTHDPNNLKKLCGAHHELAHGINVKIYELKKKAINSS